MRTRHGRPANPAERSASRADGALWYLGETYRSKSARNIEDFKMIIALASDHAGFDLKETIRAFLESSQHEVLDLGTCNTEPVDYPDSAHALGKAVLEKRAGRGVLICGSGVGASVAVNKLRGIRAGLCHDTYSAHQGVEHDDMNVLVLGSRVIGVELAKELVQAFLSANYTNEERHRRRLAKVSLMEQNPAG